MSDLSLRVRTAIELAWEADAARYAEPERCQAAALTSIAFSLASIAQDIEHQTNHPTKGDR